MPRFVAVYTVNPEDLAAFRARPKSEQEAIDKVGLQAWEEWGKRNAATIVATDVMVGKTRCVTEFGIADAQNQIGGFLVVEEVQAWLGSLICAGGAAGAAPTAPLPPAGGGGPTHP